MGIFRNIKRSLTACDDIDEKIEYLNKELEKTGLHEMMTTPNMYQQGTKVPNQNFIDFQSLSYNGYPLGLSAPDNNNVGGAVLGIDPSTGVSGVALSPPNPITGDRLRATTVINGLGDTITLRPGEKFQRGSGNNAKIITMGSAVWFYNSSSGTWSNLEYFTEPGQDGVLGFWDTVKQGQLTGLWFLNTTGPHPSGNILSLLSGINFGENGVIGPPQTIVLQKNDLSDVDFLPINIPELSKQAFFSLLSKAQQALGIDEDDNLATRIEKAKDAFINFIGMTNPIGKIIASIPVFDYASEILTSMILNEPIYQGDDDISMEDKQNYVRGVPPGYFLDGADSIPRSNQEQPYSDKNIFKNPENGEITAHTDETRKLYPDNTTTVSQSNLGALPIRGSDGTSYGDAINLDPFMITNKISARGNMQTQIVEPDDGSEVYLKVHDFAYLNEDKVDDEGELPTWFQRGIAKPLINLVNKFHGRKSGSENTGAMSGFSSNIRGSSEMEFRIPYSQWTRAQQEAYNKSKNKGVSESLNESVGLGHFEPEQLNVNIEDLRKGIMPEFPKDPPPEMIGGYAANSRLAPKKIEGEPFIKITKKDLAKNHKLKDSEIKEFMDQINAINEFIKKHPEELIHAQTRYPKHDPRLAQLNWEMDQKLEASKEYMDKHYPENQKLFTKIQKSIKKNIELTDPKSFKGVKIPKFEGVDLTDHKRRKEVVSRHYKKAIKIKKLFSKKKT